MAAERSLPLRPRKPHILRSPKFGPQPTRWEWVCWLPSAADLDGWDTVGRGQSPVEAYRDWRGLDEAMVLKGMK